MMRHSPRLPRVPSIQGAELARELTGLRESWRDPEDVAGPAGLDAMSMETGLPRPHLLAAIQRAFAPYTRPSIRRLAGMGTAGRGARPRKRGEGPWLLAILAGRVPAVAVNAVFWSLAARVPVVIKPSRELGTFTNLLARTASGGALAGSVHVTHAGSGDPVLSDMVASAPACLAYGGDRTFARIAGLRHGLPLFGGGHMESFVVLFRRALDRARVRTLARAVARDSSIYDQDGCLSPHYVLIEKGGETGPLEVAELIHEELAAIAGGLPQGRPSLEEAAGLRAFAEESRFLACSSGGSVFPARGRVWPMVVFTRGGPLRPGPGHRVLQVTSFEHTPDLPALLPFLAGRVQGVAAAGGQEHLPATFSAHPAYLAHYVCAPGRLQRPPAIWPENGIVLTRELALV